MKEIKEIRDEAGRLHAQAEYGDGKLDGINRIWNLDGQLIEQSQFKDGLRQVLMSPTGIMATRRKKGSLNMA
jgi:antitoxin component YwqK of YwqJK toxin-antitoxin module